LGAALIGTLSRTVIVSKWFVNTRLTSVVLAVFEMLLAQLSQLEVVTKCKSLKISDSIPKVCTKDYSGSSWPFWVMRGGDWGGSSQPSWASKSL
jgi:hypothetical protein